MTRFALLAYLTLAPALAAAQPPSAPLTAAEQVFVTAHAEEVPFQTLARTLVVLTRDDIARLPAHAVADLLAYSASIDVRSRGPFGVQSDFALRGSTFGQTLVLLDGLRLNDAQSGHHNGDIPVPLEEIERVEILLGPGSSLYGADAFGGTINVITRRRGTYRRVGVTGGAFGYLAGDAALAVEGNRVREAVAVSADRSSGFAADRDFVTVSASSQTTFGNGTRVWASYLWKDFGAAGFYGPALSTERTDQTLIAVDGRTPSRHGWTGQWQASYRTHGDLFRYDPSSAAAPNRHRTNTADATARLGRAIGDATRLTAGGEVGLETIRSTNLGDHDVARLSVFAEVQRRLGSTTFLYPGLRADRYSTFGTAWSPSLAASTWVGRRVKLRASVGRAFRVPTFTERFYVDPNNLGTPTLVPERAWAFEGGLDWVGTAGWTAGTAAFARQERNTIDFVRATATERWQAANVRRIDARGLEVTLRKMWGSATVSGQYTWLGAATDPLPLLSKYVLEFARHTALFTLSAPLSDTCTLGQRVVYRQRRSGADYWLADTRVSRRVDAVTLFVEGTNLLNTRYQEIAGVEMPGRALRVGVQLAQAR